LQNILPIFHIQSTAYNKLHFNGALFARNQTSFGIGQAVYFSFINIEVFLPSRYNLNGSSFPIQLFANGGI